MSLIKTFFVIGIGISLSLLGSAPVRAADGVVGPGNCNEAGFVNVLSTVIASQPQEIPTLIMHDPRLS